MFGDFGSRGELLVLFLKDAIKPNLVQTIYGTPAFAHGGLFANTTMAVLVLATNNSSAFGGLHSD